MLYISIIRLAVQYIFIKNILVDTNIDNIFMNLVKYKKFDSAKSEMYSYFKTEAVKYIVLV